MNQFLSPEIIALFKEGGFNNLVLFVQFIVIVYTLKCNYQNNKDLSAAFLNLTKTMSEHIAKEDARDEKYMQEFNTASNLISKLEQVINNFHITVTKLHSWCMAVNGNRDESTE